MAIYFCNSKTSMPSCFGMARLQKLAFLLISAAALAVTILMIAHVSLEKSNHQMTEKSLEQKILPGKLNNCSQNVYSISELRWMCAPTMKLPTCQVESIHHLRHSAFLIANLRVAGVRQMAKIFVSPQSDAMSIILTHGNVWEENTVKMVLSALKFVRGSALIDIGCNFGVYSLSAAVSGHKVVAVDANYQLVIRLRKSAEANAVTDRLSIFWNALSVVSGTVKLRYPADCSYSVSRTYKDDNMWLDDPIETATVKLDDITLQNSHLSNATSLIIKVDIEGSEWNVFATAEETFRRFNVSMVLMEWEWSVAYFPEKTQLIANFLVSRGFEAFSFGNGTVTQALQALQVKNRLKWPPDVLWLPKHSGLKKLFS